MENKYLKLLKNSGILFIANFGSQLLSFFLVPLYTYVLTREQYGTVDIITTTVSIIMPIVTLSISEATLRFAMDKQANKKSLFTISFFITLIGNAVVILLMPLLRSISDVGEYFFLFWLVLFTNSMYLTISLYARGSGYIKRFAVGGLLSTLSLVISNIVCLLVLKLGINGYLLSMAIGFLVPSIFLFFSCGLWKDFGKVENAQLKEMLAYSMPMIPNALAWLVIASSDKYILTFFHGASFNGLYVVAQKIPALINVVSSIFMQSWQLSAVAEAKAEDKDTFYSNVFNTLVAVLLGVTACATAIIKPFYSLWLEESYFEAWKYTTILMAANAFSCFSNFVGTNYIAMKKTTGSMKTIIFGGLVNIILNFIFIPKYGIYAASLTTLFSFLVTWLVRLYDTRNFAHLKIDVLRLVLMCVIITIQYLALYTSYNLLVQPICLLAVIVLYFNIIKNFALIAKNTIINKVRGN